MPIYLSKSTHVYVKFSNITYTIDKENDFRRTSFTGYTKDGYIKTQRSLIHSVSKIIKIETQRKKDMQVLNYNRELIGLPKIKPIKQEKIKESNVSITFDNDTIYIKRS